MSDETSNIRKLLTFSFIIIPPLSLCMSALYYYVFFLFFENLSTRILTVADYIDKSIEFIGPLFIFLIFGTFLSIIFLPYLGKTVTTKKDTIKETTSNTSPKLIRFALFYLIIAVICGLSFLVFTFFYADSRVFKYYAIISLFLIFLALSLYILVKNTPKLRDWILISEEKTSGIFFQYLHFSILIIGIGYTSIFMAGSSANKVIQSAKLENDTIYFDVISSGYLIGDKGKFVLTNKNKEALVSSDIREMNQASLACKLGMKFVCKEQSTPPE